MIRTMLSSAAVLAAVFVGAPTFVSPAFASPAQPPRARLTLTYMSNAGSASAVKLTCSPAGGGHPEADQACATLKTTGADPGKIKPAAVMCMMLYSPVTAEISGVWHGTHLQWTHKYGNTCEMTRATGVLFKF